MLLAVETHKLSVAVSSSVTEQGERSRIHSFLPHNLYALKPKSVQYIKRSFCSRPPSVTPAS